jgi:uncharacterized protein with HEPN domain
MTKRELDDFLQDILEAIGAVERFLAGVSFEEFAQNEEKIFAVEKAMEIIGEAVKNLPDSLRSQYPEIPWKNIAGMRDKLVHEYWVQMSIFYGGTHNREVLNLRGSNQD